MVFPPRPSRVLLRWAHHVGIGRADLTAWIGGNKPGSSGPFSCFQDIVSGSLVKCASMNNRFRQVALTLRKVRARGRCPRRLSVLLFTFKFLKTWYMLGFI